MIRQEIIRDKDYNIIETIDNGLHLKYNLNGNIVFYKSDNFEYPFFKLINSPQEQEFINIVKDRIIKIDKDCIFLVGKTRYVFKYNSEYNESYFNYELIWEVFENKYSMNDEQIEMFLKEMMEKHFNCKGIIPVFPCTNGGGID